VNLLRKWRLRGLDSILRKERLRRRASTNLASNGRITSYIYVQRPLFLTMTNKQYFSSINLESCTHYRATCGSRPVSTADYTIQIAANIILSFVLFSVNLCTICYFGVFFFALSIFCLHPTFPGIA